METKSARKYIPTGIQEQVVITCGGGKFSVEEREDENYKIYKQVVVSDEVMPLRLERGGGEKLFVNIIGANKIGKTTAAINIVKNICYGPDREYFNYPLYWKWPFCNIDGDIIKSGAIISNHSHLADSGMVHKEILKWFPKNRFEMNKGNHKYVSEYKTDTGWNVTCLTPGMNPKEYESHLWSWFWVDEPIDDEELIGCLNGRLAHGGLGIYTYTPYNAGIMAATVDDLRRAGNRVITMVFPLTENDSETGTMNSKGTMRGTMTPTEIEEYKKGIPASQVRQRIYAEVTGLSGHVYKFQKDIHVTYDYDFSSQIFKNANTFVCCDPHTKYYPFFSFWAITEPIFEGKSKIICFNEWPTYDHLNGYYDEKRKVHEFQMPVPQIVNVINVLSCIDFGFPIPRYGIDGRFARNNMSSNQYTGSSAGKIQEYAPHGIRWELPDDKLQEVGRDWLHSMLYCDPDRPYGIFNCPQLYFLPHCLNMIRCFENHYWIEGQEKEAERYKDCVDTARILHGLIGSDYKWQNNINKYLKKNRIIIKSTEKYMDYYTLFRQAQVDSVLT